MYVTKHTEGDKPCNFGIEIELTESLEKNSSNHSYTFRRNHAKQDVTQSSRA